MNTFVVSARKYRPQRFAEVKGQKHVIQTLKNAIKSGQVASALLFCGPRGSGKTTSARLMGKTINCDAPTLEGEPCNQCTYCLQFQQQTTFNIHELDAASHNSAEDMRRIVDQMRYHPPKGKKNIIIIDEAHMLSNAALNVLLKPLEDTPPHVVFILVTTEKHKIIPTVLSRCQVFDFHRIKENEIIAQLRYVAEQENITFDESALELISQRSAGSLRDALSTFDLIATYHMEGAVTYAAVLDQLRLLDDQLYFDITSAIEKGDMATILNMYNDIMKTGFDGQDFITGWAQYLRNLLLLKTSPNTSLAKIPSHLEKQYNEKASDISTSLLYKLLHIAQEGDMHYKDTLNEQLFVELMLIKAAQLNQQRKVSLEVTSKPTPYYTKPKVEEPIAELAEPKPTTYGKPSVPSTPTTVSSPPSVSSPPTKTSTTPLPPSQPLAPSPLSKDAKNIKLSDLHALKNHLDSSAISSTPLPIPPKKAAASQLPPKPLTQADITPHWNTYQATYSIQGLNQKQNLLNNPITVEGHTIIVDVKNADEQNRFQEIQKELTKFLKDKLAHPMLTITTRIKAPQKAKIDTPQEKLAALETKYPHVAHLKEKLDLVAY